MINFQETKSLIANRGLKDLSSIPIGCGSFDIRKALNEEKYNSILTKNFNSITPEDDMKMDAVIASEGNYNWSVIDKIVSYCEQNNIRLFGHTLIWHGKTPEWVVEKAKENGAEWLVKFMKEYIHTVVDRYKGKVAAWDVINEGIETFGGKLRNSVWYDNLGIEYIEQAFRYAHEADPQAELFYNDFNLERDTEKLNAAVKLISDLKAKDIPITGFGLQMHLRMDIPDDSIAKALEKAASTGLKIHLSEMDIIFNTHNDSKGGGIQLVEKIADSLLEEQALKYKNIAMMYRKIVPKAQQFGISFWGFNDRDTWINHFFNLNDWPTLFDKNLDEKPAYFGFAKGLL